MSLNSENFVYDALGNPTTYRNKALVWEKARQLKQYDSTTFEYNGRGQRTKKTGGTTVTYVYDNGGKLVLQDYPQQGKKLKFYYDFEGLCAVQHGSEKYFYRHNAQGDVIALLDTSGAVVVRYVYDAWGKHEILDAAGKTLQYKENDEENNKLYELATMNPFRYRGYYYDVETGLYFLKTRYYDPETGRFINADSIAFLSAAFINGTNLYAYCCNNPVMFYDPMGTGKIKNFFKKLGKVILGAVLYAVGASLAVSTLPLAMAIPGGGFLTQAGVSLAAYGGFMAASAFDDTINADMQAIGWNPFNTNEIAVVESEKVSFYKGVPVIRINQSKGRSGTFLGIFLDGSADADTVRHEWGHTIQQGIIGPIRFGLTYAITSSAELSKKYYYDRAWEVTADVFGGVEGEVHSAKDIAIGWGYLLTTLFFGPLSYLFLIGEYMV